MRDEERKAILDELTGLLNRQLSAARRGGFSETEQLSRKINDLALRIGPDDNPDSETAEKIKKIKKMFEQMEIILSAQTVETADELSNIRKGRKTIRAYKASI